VIAWDYTDFQASALGEWEAYTKGIGSKLMKKMGYVWGSGLGKSSEGRVEPIEAVVLPVGKSLDYCLQFKEIFGCDQLINSLKVKKFKCIYTNCEIIQDWERITNHIKKCTSENNDVRVNISYIPYSYSHQF